MKPLLLSTADIRGGAARATYRLQRSLQQIGVDSRMLVRDRQSVDPSVLTATGRIARVLMARSQTFDKLPRLLYRKRQFIPWSTAWFPNAVSREVARLNPDIVHLHWVGYGFVPIEALPHFHKPMVWTLHDMWALTGGCHYDQECGRYQQHCGRCPQLNTTRAHDLSRWTLWRKQRAWHNLRLTIVAPSRWLSECARNSAIFHDVRIETIPYGLDLACFKPIDRLTSRAALSLPQDKQLILFGSMDSTRDTRKGFQFLPAALQHLADGEIEQRAELMIFGAPQPAQPPDLKLRCHWLGHIADDARLAQVYAAADVFVAPSTQDNLPNTVLEALACGTPCVAFRIGGMPDLIEHEQTGYLARPFDPVDLARGIRYVLSDRDRQAALARSARAKAEREFDLIQEAQRYAALYQDMLH